MDTSKARVKKMVTSRIIMALLIVGLFLFIPAGTLLYWQGWLYIGVLFIPMLVVVLYLMKHDPDLLERRMKTQEKEGVQKIIIGVSVLIFLIGFSLPGLDFRFGWSEVPVTVVLAADGIIFLGYLIFSLTLRENSYASRVVEVEKEQTVISTGPYAIVRHPMYLGILLIYLFTPIALGSYLAVSVFFLFVPLLVYRIRNEEEVLVRELPGYSEYRKKTRYRLIPFVW